MRLGIVTGIVVMVSIVVYVTTGAMAAEQISSSNFASNFPKVYPSKDYYKIGEKITVNYVIKPKTDDDRKKLDNRHYVLSTDLNDVKWVVVIYYYKGGIVYRDLPHDKEVDVFVNDWEEGLKKIVINLTGIIPEIDSWYSNVTVIKFKISDADENSLQPVTVDVVNPDKFSKELEDVENKYNVLYQKVQNVEFDVENVLNFLKKADKDINYAKDYFSRNKFLEASDSLKSAKDEIANAEFEFNKSELSYSYELARENLDNISIELTGLEYKLDQLQNKGADVITLKVNLAKLKSQKSDIDSELSKIQSFIDSENFDLARAKIEKVEGMISELKSELKNLKSGIEALEKEQKGFFEAIFEKFRVDYILYGGAAVALLLVVFVIVKFIKRGRRKWDELR